MAAPDELTRERRDYGTRVLARRLRRWGWIFAVAVGLVVWQVSVGDEFNQAYSLMFFALMVLAIYLVISSYYPHSGDEPAWRLAVARREWRDALGLAARLPVSEGEQVMLRARALTGLGRWAEAQAAVKGLTPEDLPRGRYWELLADVFETRGDDAARRRALERAVHEHPRPLYVMLALAEIALVEDRDPKACKHWLDRIRDKDKPAATGAAMLTLRGGMAFEEEDDDEAIEVLERGLEQLAIEVTSDPTIERWSGTMQAYLSMARARRGELGEARILAKDARAALARFGPERLRARLDAALAGDR